MIKVGDKIYRNLEEQVQYLTNYHDVNQGIAQWGIRVVGQVESESELPESYDGEYGDAIAVGTEAPYYFYIWTRASIEGNPAYWFPFGEISIVGPQGPEGPQGDKGDNGQSTMWYYGTSAPTAEDSYVEGDMYLQNSGQVYRYNGSTWVSITNIKGPQGIQGPRGEVGPQGEQGPVGPAGPQGDVGGFINIWGVLGNVEQLPTPLSLNNLTAAYLVEHTGGTDQANDHYDLYVQVGATSETAIWTNTGPFNAATLVTQGGVGLNVWDADTKLDKRTGLTQRNQAYVKTSAGENTMFDIAVDSVANALVRRKADGTVMVPDVPSEATAATSKSYVDSQISNKCVQKVSGATDYAQVYGKTAAGTQLTIDISRSVIASAIPQRQVNGNIRVPNTPTADNDAASKQYVDNSAMYCKYTEYTGGTVYLLDVEGYYMIYSTSDNADIRIYDSDGDVITGAKQLQFVAATQTKYPTGSFKLCGIKYGGSSYDVESFRRAAKRGAFINAPGGFAVCEMTKPFIEE